MVAGVWGSLALLSSSGLFASGLSCCVVLRAVSGGVGPVLGGGGGGGGGGWVAGWSGAFGSGVCLPVGLMGV